MCTRRLPLRPAILGAFVLAAAGVAAGSASTPLAVGVTVVRSCAVRATSIGRGFAQVDLTCASGAASNVTRTNGRGSQSEDLRTLLRLQIPTSPFRGVADNGGLEVATVNF
jgi:hypothetical protein